MSNVIIDDQRGIQKARSRQNLEKIMHAITGLLKISTLSVALLASTAIVATVAMPDVAYAGNGNGNSGGNGGGNSGNSDASSDNGKSANSKAASAKSKRDQKTNTRKTSGNPLKALGDIFKKKSDAPKIKRVAKTKRVTKTATAPKPRGNPLARTLGVHPSELGALNAANASPNALANASPNSRVGKLAIYAEEVEATRTIEAGLIEAQAVLDTMDAPEHSSEQIDLAIAEADSAKLTRLDELDGLMADLEGAGGTDATIESEIEAATNDIVELDEQISELMQEREDGTAYEVAAEDVASFNDALATQSDTQRSALEAAANKEVTDEVEAAVQSLLGIYQEPTSEDDVLLEEEILEEDVVALD